MNKNTFKLFIDKNSTYNINDFEFVKMVKEHFVQQCINLAKKSIVKYQHGSVIVNNGKIIGCGFNKLFPKGGIMNTCHAEVNAILSLQKAPKYCKNSTIYVIRLSGKKENEFGDSKPCQNCLNRIKQHNISRVFYSTPNGFQSLFL